MKKALVETMVTTQANRLIDSLKVFFVLAILLVPFCSCDQNGDMKSISKSGTARSTGRVPTLKFIDKEERGCSRVQFYKGSEDRREYLVIQIDMAKLGISDGESITIDLGEPPAGIEVRIDLFDTPPKFLPYCNDVLGENTWQATWQGKKGKITLKSEKATSEIFSASLRLENVEFVDDFGNRALLPLETFNDVRVGWSAG